jgi:hypothetical protein
MTEALTPAPRSAPDAEVDQRFLELLADQSRRVPVAAFFLLMLLAVMAATRVAPLLTAVWFAVAVGTVQFRRHVLSALPGRCDFTLRSRLRVAVALSCFNGIVHGSSLSVFPFLADTERSSRRPSRNSA